ncbi:unnamed protein product, partial [Ectocarpus sp. 13 AM-2016]
VKCCDNRPRCFERLRSPTYKAGGGNVSRACRNVSLHPSSSASTRPLIRVRGATDKTRRDFARHALSSPQRPTKPIPVLSKQINRPQHEQGQESEKQEGKKQKLTSQSPRLM